MFELRPRIGVASPTLSEYIPDDEIVADAVVNARQAKRSRTALDRALAGAATEFEAEPASG